MRKKLFTLALMACLACCAWADDTTDAISAKVSGTTLNIGLTNATTYCAFQMDITLPSGVSASAVEAVAARLSQEGSDTEVGGAKFIVSSNQIDATNNVWRVLAYNLNNNQIAGTSGGNILNITLNAAVADPTTITVSNIIFVDKSNLTGIDTFASATGKLLGDVNGDNTVNALDVAGIIDIVLGNDVSSLDDDVADINDDNQVNALDVAGVIDITLNK